MRKLPLSQWGAVRVCLFCFEFSLGRGAKAPSPPQREFEAKKTDAHRMYAAPANSAMFISQISLFCFELSLGRGAAPRCKVCAWSLSLSQPRTPRRCPYLLTRCHTVSRRSSPGTLCRSGARWLLSASEPPLQPAPSWRFCWCLAHDEGKNLSIKANVPR